LRKRNINEEILLEKINTSYIRLPLYYVGRHEDGWMWDEDDEKLFTKLDVFFPSLHPHSNPTPLLT
jgi:hypothetical protein